MLIGFCVNETAVRIWNDATTGNCCNDQIHNILSHKYHTNGARLRLFRVDLHRGTIDRNAFDAILENMVTVKPEQSSIKQ